MFFKKMGSEKLRRLSDFFPGFSGGSEHSQIRRKLERFNRSQTGEPRFFPLFRRKSQKIGEFRLLESMPGISSPRHALLRLAMALSLVWTFNLTVAISQYRPPAAEVPAAEIIPPEQGGGMGMTYVDLPEQNDNPIAGVAEPQDFFRPQVLLYDSYRVSRGDTIGALAIKFGLNQDTLISANNIQNSRLLQIGQVIRAPNQDGILYKVKKGDTLSSIGSQHKVEPGAIQTVNELFSEQVNAGTTIFIPGAKLDFTNLQEINGDLFLWPLRGYITSLYGYRINPITEKGRQFHTGLDIAAPTGTPIRAAMAGRVSATGYNPATGNYVIINHHSGYRTLYGHMSVIRARAGSYVDAGDRIGDVGSTGMSTGPHLHFTVYKNGATVNPRSLLN